MLSLLTTTVLSLSSSEHMLLQKRMRKETQVGICDPYTSTHTHTHTHTHNLKSDAQLCLHICIDILYTHANDTHTSTHMCTHIHSLNLTV